MASIGEYVATFRADFDAFLAPLKATQKETQQFQRSLKPLTDGMTAIGVAASAAGGAVVASFVGMAKAAANYGDSIRDAKIRTGETTEQLSALKFIAEQNGTSFEAVSTGLKFLAKNAANNADEFRRLGISIKDAQGNTKSVNDIFQETRNRLRLVTDEVAKTDLMMKLFGRSGVELTEIMGLSNAEFDAMTAKAGDLGLILGDEAAAQADAFNDSLNEVKNATLGFSIAIGNSLLPALTDFAKKATDIVVTLRQWAEAYPSVTRGTFALAAAIGGAGGLLVGTTVLIAHIKELKLALALLTAPLSLATGAIIGLVGALVIFRNEFAAGVISALAEVARSIGWVILGMSKLSGIISKDAAEGFKKDALAAFETAEKMSQLSDSFLENTDVVVSNMDTFQKWKAGLDSGTIVIGKTKEELDKAAKAAKEAGDAAAELWLALRSAKDVERNIHDVVGGLGLAIPALEEIHVQFKGVFDDVSNVTAQSELLNQTLEAIGNTTAHAAQQQADMFDALARDAKKVKDAYDDTFKSVKNTAMHTFLEIFKDGEFRFGALAGAIKGIFATLANEILSTMTAKLLTPLVQKLTSALSGILGKIPGLGGVFVGAGGAGGGATAGGAAAGGAGISAGAVAATAGIAAAIIAGIAVVKSQAHWEANTLIKTVHDPFVASIKEIHDAFFAAAETGHLTSDAAKSAREDTQALWDSFKEQAAAFAKGGSDEARVVEQMFARLNEVWGSDLANIFSGMDSVIATIKDVGVELERLAAVQDLTDRVTMAASGFGDMEQALANLIETGMEWGPIVEFLGDDILTMAHNMEALGLTVPPYIQAVVDQINANIELVNANERLTQSMERHGEVIEGMSDVYDELVSAVVSKVDLLDQGISDSRSAIEGWKNEIDAATDAVKASGDELKRMANQRASLEDQIKKIEIQGQRDLLVAALDAAKATSSTTSSVLTTMTRASGITAAGHAWSSLDTTISNITESTGSIVEAEKALAEFDAVQRKSEMSERMNQLVELKRQLAETITQEAMARVAHESQIVAARAMVSSLSERIRLENEHIAVMQADRIATVALFDALNGVRLTELQTIDSTIDTLLLRASALNAERMALEALTGQTSTVSDSIADMIANVQTARLSPPLSSAGIPSGPGAGGGPAVHVNIGDIHIEGSGVSSREGMEGLARELVDHINRQVQRASVTLYATALTK